MLSVLVPGNFPFYFDEIQDISPIIQVGPLPFISFSSFSMHTGWSSTLHFIFKLLYVCPSLAHSVSPSFSQGFNRFFVRKLYNMHSLFWVPLSSLFVNYFAAMDSLSFPLRHGTYTGWLSLTYRC